MARDSELYKDKIEVSLDGRQIFYLFFGGAVIVGLVFVLGVMVGRRVEARSHVDRARTTAAVDPLAALDRLEGGNGLSFQDSLRGEPAASTVDKKIDDLAAARPAAAQARPAPRPAADEAHAQAEDHVAVDDVKPAKKADDDGDKQPAVKKADDKKTADKKSADKKSDDKKPADKKSDDKKGRRYTLQVSSFQDRAEAEALVTTLKSSGYPAQVSAADVDGKTFYRVRLGTYHSVDAANDARAELERTMKRSASVMRL